MNVPRLRMFAGPNGSGKSTIKSVVLETDEELAVLEQRQAKTRALKQGMMRELLTGRTRKRMATAFKIIL